MRILVIGSGGREHALCWRLAQSPKVSKIYCAPGNAGIARVAECVDIPVSDLPALAEFAEKNAVGLTVVGPEVPLCAGIVDVFQAKGLKAFGPSRQAAQLEGSKVFSKQFLLKHNVPTAAAGIFNNAEEARAFLKKVGAPIVVKADGLAAGAGTRVPV